MKASANCKLNHSKKEAVDISGVCKSQEAAGVPLVPMLKEYKDVCYGH